MRTSSASSRMTGATTDGRARLPPKVRIMQIAGPAYTDDQVANISLAYGAKLMGKAHASKEDRAKARPAWEG